MQLGARGVSILFASGDGGVAGGRPASCTTFVPTFPSGCPFVTSVGATQVVAGHKVTDPESASYDRIFSGGGFSNYFAIPDYQKSAVQGFLANHPPPYSGEIFNATGTSRAFPDLSANGCVLPSF